MSKEKHVTFTPGPCRAIKSNQTKRGVLSMNDTKEKRALQIVINEAEISALGDSDKVVLKAVEITKANARLIAAGREAYDELVRVSQFN